MAFGEIPVFHKCSHYDIDKVRPAVVMDINARGLVVLMELL